MFIHSKSALALVVGLVCGSAFAAGSLEEWEMTTKMTNGNNEMPAQKMIVCQKKVEGAPPPMQSNCKYTNMGMSGGKGTFTMECSGEHPATIKGEGTQTADTMEATMTVLSAGMEIKSAYSGRRLGSCSTEGSRSVGGPGLSGMSVGGLFDPRNRPASGSGAFGPPGAEAAHAAASGDPTAAADQAAADEKSKAASGTDTAKKALKSLLPF